MNELTMIAIGWALGALTMWWHFHRSRLIRSRAEWYGGGYCRCCETAGQVTIHLPPLDCDCPCHGEDVPE